MSSAPRLRRRRGGFTLLEAMMAGVIFLVGATGVTIFAGQMGLLGRKGVLNSQMAQLARDEINRATIKGMAGLPPSSLGVGHTLPNGMILDVDVEIFDTGGPKGMELPNQLPGCDNIAAPSQCVRVKVKDKSGANTYMTATYVTP